MKKLILLLAVTLVVFSCSKDNVNTETETTADLTQMTPSKSLDDKSEGLYVGVFGHYQNKDLHGKIYINAGNNENYTAKIELVNGQELNFRAEQGGSNIHFEGDRGSFDFNIVNFNQPTASNVIVDSVADAYIVAKKQTTRGGSIFVLTGSYEQDGNPSYFGNWDMIGNGIDGSGELGGQLITDVIISHQGSPGPYHDAVMETNPATACIASSEPFISSVSAPYPEVDVMIAAGQTSSFGNRTVSWSLTHDQGNYYDNTCAIIPSGVWSFANKTGAIYSDYFGPSPLQSIPGSFSK